MGHPVAATAHRSGRPGAVSAHAAAAEPRPIRRLAPETVDRIAAGEVVERPASVVKELVENSVDAGASEVRIRLEGGGLEAIVVDDDGRGIPAAELPLAVERHATSKLEDAEELAEIVTLGFRGEALAAIGAVARLRVLSRPPEAEAAHGISVVGGAVVGQFLAGRAPGTTVEVGELFFNTPARRKFLASPAAEQVEVAAAVERLYLARPTVGLVLANERGELLRLAPADSLRDAVARAIGPEFLAQSFEVRGGAPPVEIEAVLGRPAVARSTSGGLYLSINGRGVQSRTLAQAVRQAYSEYLPRTRFPVGVVQLRIDLKRVDVNVHPTKREVRVAKEREVADLLRRTVREALLESPHVAERPSAAAGPVPPSRVRLAIEHLPPLPGEGASTPPAAPVPAHAAQRRLLDAAPASGVGGSRRHPGLRLLGPVFRLYWAAESDDGALVLVDQHAASERVVYESLRRDGRLARQELVAPVRVELGGRRAAALSEHEETIRRAGFVVERFGPSEHRVLAVPSYRGRRVRAEELAALLDELSSGGRPVVPEGLVERVDASIACHAAIRGGDVVAPEEMAQVLAALYALSESSYACPHGRPILVRFPRSRIDRWFLRSGA